MLQNNNLINKKDLDFMFFDIVKSAILTEKSVQIENGNNCLIFYTYKNINKTIIRKATGHVFKTTVLNVRVINIKSKLKKFRGKPFLTESKKKVIVRLESMEHAKEVFNDA